MLGVRPFPFQEADVGSIVPKTNLVPGMQLMQGPTKTIFVSDLS